MEYYDSREWKDPEQERLLRQQNPGNYSVEEGGTWRPGAHNARPSFPGQIPGTGMLGWTPERAERERLLRQQNPGNYAVEDGGTWMPGQGEMGPPWASPQTYEPPAGMQQMAQQPNRLGNRMADKWSQYRPRPMQSLSTPDARQSAWQQIVRQANANGAALGRAQLGAQYQPAFGALAPVGRQPMNPAPQAMMKYKPQQSEQDPPSRNSRLRE